MSTLIQIIPVSHHSSIVTVTNSDLAELAGSFALLGHYSGEVAQLLDAVLGFAKRRIDSRHLNAVSRLDHTAQARLRFQTGTPLLFTISL